MKKIILTSLVATALLVGCSKGNDIPQECLDLVDVTMELAEKTGQSVPQSRDEMTKELEDKWGTMSDDEKEKAAQDCKKASAMMEMLNKAS